MHRVFVSAVAGAALLAACSGLVITPQTVVDFIKANCGVVVQIADIVALISANPFAISAAALGDKVCTAVNAEKAAMGAAPKTAGTVIVDGVPVKWSVK